MDRLGRPQPPLTGVHNAEVLAKLVSRPTLIGAAAMTARIDIMKGFSWKIQRTTGISRNEGVLSRW
jgi:hypothetical protein